MYTHTHTHTSTYTYILHTQIPALDSQQEVMKNLLFILPVNAGLWVMGWLAAQIIHKRYPLTEEQIANQQAQAAPRKQRSVRRRHLKEKKEQ
jgi:hypothetical protein